MYRSRSALSGRCRSLLTFGLRLRAHIMPVVDGYISRCPGFPVFVLIVLQHQATADMDQTALVEPGLADAVGNVLLPGTRIKGSILLRAKLLVYSDSEGDILLIILACAKFRLIDKAYVLPFRLFKQT